MSKKKKKKKERKPCPCVCFATDVDLCKKWFVRESEKLFMGERYSVK